MNLMIVAIVVLSTFVYAGVWLVVFGLPDLPRPKALSVETLRAGPDPAPSQPPPAEVRPTGPTGNDSAANGSAVNGSSVDGSAGDGRRRR